VDKVKDFVLAGIKINRDFTEDIIVECGVKKADPLSATLFSLVVDTILKQMGLRRNITARLKRCTACADDNMLTTGTKQKCIGSIWTDCKWSENKIH
jgi:hypothetical protein